MRLNLLFFIALLIPLLLIACQPPIQNYEEENSPYFAGNYAPVEYPFTGDLKIVSWNIKFGTEVEQAIKELQEVEALQDADILLLQEMDEDGVEKIAQTLAYDYIYFPASIHRKNGNNFGNAILSKWELSEPEKIILPHKNPKNGQVRMATKAMTTIGDLQIPLYSIHTETAWLSNEKRNEQVDTIIADIGDAQFVFVGGDFNSITPAGVAILDEKFAKIGMIRVSAGAEPTVEIAGANFSADHIFARNAILIENGAWSETKASDHYPVWVTVSLQDWFSDE